MKRIELTQGQVALVDDADYEWLSKWKWHARKRGKTFYAVRCTQEPGGKKHFVRMHREIMQTPDGMETDHRNGDGLDNRRSNLRVCTHAENAYNQGLRASNTSGYKGVSWYKRIGKWDARIKVNGKQIHLGYYTDKDDAARAYNEAALQLHGEFARADI